MSSTGRWVLASVAALEGLAALSRFEERKQYFADATQRARDTGRTLVVIGNPDGGAHTRLLRAYGCGDVCIDIVGCDACSVSVTADITAGPVSKVPSNSAVVYVSCVLEYVSAGINDIEGRTCYRSREISLCRRSYGIASMGDE